jgi:hypothetical protein
MHVVAHLVRQATGNRTLNNTALLRPSENYIAEAADRFLPCNQPWCIAMALSAAKNQARHMRSRGALRRPGGVNTVHAA